MVDVSMLKVQKQRGLANSAEKCCWIYQFKMCFFILFLFFITVCSVIMFTFLLYFYLIILATTAVLISVKTTDLFYSVL